MKRKTTTTTTTTTTASITTSKVKEESGDAIEQPETVINGDLVWNTPSLYDELNVKDIFMYRVTTEKLVNNNHIQIPHSNISRLQIVVTNDRLLQQQYRNKGSPAPIIPSSISYLEIHLDIGMISRDYMSVINFIKSLEIPPTVTSLAITSSTWKESLEKIVYGILESDKLITKKRKTSKSSKEPIYDYFVPPTVKTLSIPWTTKDIKEFIPPTVLHLVLQDQPTSISNLNVPSTVEHVEFESLEIKFQPLSLLNLPDGVKTVTTGSFYSKHHVQHMHYRFNMLYDTSVLHTILMRYFSRASESLAKDNICIFSSYRTVTNENPKTVIFLTGTTSAFPPSTRSVYFPPFYNYPLTLPVGVEYVRLGNYITHFVLPPTLKYLALGEDFHDFLYGNRYIPTSTIYLEIYIGTSIQYKGYIPKSVKYLKINSIPGKTNKLKDSSFIFLPKSLIHVDIDPMYVDRIKMLEEDDYYQDNRKLFYTNYTNLKSLVLPDSFNHYIPMLPSNITQLTIGRGFDQPLDSNLIPPSVTSIVFNNKNLLLLKNLPSTVKQLEYSYPTSVDQVDQFKRVFLNIDIKQRLDIEPKLEGGLIITLGQVKIISDQPKPMVLDTLKIHFYYRAYSSTINNLLDPSRRGGDVGKKYIFSPREHINIDILPFVKDVTFDYEPNKGFVLKPRDENEKSNLENNNNNKNNNIRLTEPIKPGSDLFFYIWKNRYLRQIISERLISPNDELVQVERPIMGSNTLRIDKQLALSRVVVSPNISKIVMFTHVLKGLTKTIPKKIFNVLEYQYYFYKKDKPIPQGTKYVFWSLNQLIPIGCIPDSVVSIVFCNSYNQIVLENSIPDSVQHIEFGYNFAQSLEYVYLPPKLVYLGFERDIAIIPNKLPGTLKQVVFQNLGRLAYNSLHLLPPSVERLGVTIEKDYTHIPLSIKYLKIFHPRHRVYFNRGTLSIPPSVKYVTIPKGPIFTIEVAKASSAKPSQQQQHQQQQPKIPYLGDNIPQGVNIHLRCTEVLLRPNMLIGNIKTIILDGLYNSTLVPGSIPNTVETLYIKNDIYDQPILPNVLPSGLKKLVFGFRFNQKISPGILSSLSDLEELEFAESFDQTLDLQLLPPNLKKLSFKRGFYDQSLLDWIPSSVNNLTIGSLRPHIRNMNCFPIEKLPTTITHLSLGDNQNIESPNLIPPHIKHLRLGPCKNYDGCVPQSVEHLEISMFHNYPLHLLLPPH
ncbi:hypothetical protein CYY_005540 [Polysphondylium violaceum]|uniref:FNIP repeat-containing protein n=1 Tax=Polysphondylium violaceum TaxID=133409 RepID=A0A8J4Q2W5_9MYCE|nr:hypothetical protein CYY_005540 [Polysphondylium violaceum]